MIMHAYTPWMTSTTKDQNFATIIIFPRVTTSFERHDFGYWRNNTSGDLMWLPNMEKTPSPNTGPGWALDGQITATWKGADQQRLKAILRGPKCLRECFCIRSACHMMVDPKKSDRNCCNRGNNISRA
ncbi:uncharacterized protein LOC144424568 [Styela clava]